MYMNLQPAGGDNDNVSRAYKIRVYFAALLANGAKQRLRHEKP